VTTYLIISRIVRNQRQHSYQQVSHSPPLLIKIAREAVFLAHIYRFISEVFREKPGRTPTCSHLTLTRKEELPKSNYTITTCLPSQLLEVIFALPRSSR